MSILRDTTLFVVLAAGLLGCGSSSNPTPPDALPIVTPDGGGASPDTSVSPDAAAGDGLADTAVADADVTDGGVGAEAGGDGPPGVPGCLPGKPTDRNSPTFLNACGPGTCYPFNNARLTRLAGGVLPPLP